MNKLSLLIISSFILLLFTPVSARPEYARQTSQPCSTCHVNVTTGELNEVGIAFSATHRWPPGEITYGQRIFASIAGFFHLLASMILVGSMVFVHLVYTADSLAVTGVPKKELTLGWISLLILGLTGIYLTINRFHDVDNLLGSSTGRLVVVKIIIYSIMVTFAGVVILVLNKRLKSIHQQTPQSEDFDEMTLDELKKFDGSTGKTYLAYAGVIYDVSNSRLWKGGKHADRHSAGNDLTIAIKESPHGTDVLKALQIVARVKQQSEQKPPALAVKVFKAMAIINFILALVAAGLSALIAWPL